MMKTGKGNEIVDDRVTILVVNVFNNVIVEMTSGHKRER